MVESLKSSSWVGKPGGPFKSTPKNGDKKNIRVENPVFNHSFMSNALDVIDRVLLDHVLNQGQI